SWSAASRSVPHLWELLHNFDAYNGLYYLLLHYWMSVFGDSVFAMRLPSALAMAAAAGCVTHIGRQMFCARAGLFAGLAFAAMPSVSAYAQQARGYALTVLAVAVGTIVLLRAVQRPRWWAWPVFALVLVLIGWLKLVALAVVPAYAVVLAVAAIQRRD